ncbi:glycosyltransferase [Breoghania sp. L-A4]|uniref:glycosyltransferase family 2 protein n=1 Tax=Breoghania sp. L-A4 TaxID=2304600 RepID=UPI000E35DB80|nr:glycosyltransferase [Breoghania sp. L-A4]AXS40441.1 glycosyltransferase [Breoghania sp. L-A4]
MKVSIAIPTRDRGVYLASCLAVCTAIGDPDLEIVVSDNASTDDTADVVASFNDARIRYIRTPGASASGRISRMRWITPPATM